MIDQTHDPITDFINAVTADVIDFAALQQTKWKISGDNSAAELLEIKATTLASRMKKIKFERPR